MYLHVIITNQNVLISVSMYDTVLKDELCL